MIKICFLGNMNNFPFEIAIKFVKLNYEVEFYVDQPKAYLLDRPESYSNEFSSGLPNWIIDLTSNPMFHKRGFFFLFPNLFFGKLIKKLNTYDVVFVNGDWVKLGKYISKNKYVVGLLAGSEMDDCDFDRIKTEIIKAKSRNFFFRFFPNFVLNIIYSRLVNLVRNGIERLDLVNYYLPEINAKGELLLNEIKSNQKYKRLILRGVDVNLYPYIEREIESKNFTILSVTRFFYKTIQNDNKRNDLMIKGIANFIKENKISNGLKIIFFEKGGDLEDAKKLCNQLGIDKFIEWKRQVSSSSLLEFYENCDVVFDQLGNQWVGAGVFSMLVGRPLIANGRVDLYEKYLGERFPVCNAINDIEVSQWLTKIYKNRNLVNSIGKESSDYVRKHYNIDNNIDIYINEFNTFFKSN